MYPSVFSLPSEQNIALLPDSVLSYQMVALLLTITFDESHGAK